MNVHSIDLKQSFSLAPEVTLQRFDEKAILVDLASELVYQLNGTGARVVELLVAGHSLQEVYRLLSEEFQVSLEDLKHDIDLLLENLTDNRLIVAKQPEA